MHSTEQVRYYVLYKGNKSDGFLTFELARKFAEQVVNFYKEARIEKHDEYFDGHYNEWVTETAHIIKILKA